jgi:RND family efflux transporter MFP subunit
VTPRSSLLEAPLVALLVALLVACKGGDHGHMHPGGDPGHAHDPGGGDALPGQSVTRWAERTELFAEFPPLVVGRESRFAAHVTETTTFKAVNAGTATVTLTYDDGTTLVATADAPSNPGIFRPTLMPTKPGKCTLRFEVKSPQASEAFEVGPCEVYADVATARKALGEAVDEPGRITYLKEQAWKTDFALALVAERDLQDGVRSAGEIRPVAGKEARLSSPAAGRVTLVEPVPLLGMPVAKGQVLATVAPRFMAGGDRATLAADVGAAEAEVDAAQAALARAERLLADQAGTAKAVDESTTRLRVAEAHLRGARGRLAQFDAGADGGGGRVFQVRAPIDGTLVLMAAASGESVEEGQLLFQVIDLTRVWLVASVFEPDVPKVEGARAAWFTIEGYDQPFVVDDASGKLVTIGRVVDPRTRTVPVIFEVQNRAGKLRIGNFTQVLIATGTPKKALAIPESALVDDAGRQVAYVMVEGEAFERRPLTLGIRSGGWVQVLVGLSPGERVVSRGAYEIKLAASAASVPAHGHAH